MLTYALYIQYDQILRGTCAYEAVSTQIAVEWELKKVKMLDTYLDLSVNCLLLIVVSTLKRSK